MNPPAPGTIITIILFAFIILSGIWLTKSGRPLNTVLFSIHKILAIIAIILTVITIYHLQKGIDLRNPELILILATGVFFLLELVSGALLSFDSLVNETVLTIHKITPSLIVISTVLTIYFLIQAV
ncbi:MAG TPA: hypothetical protein VMW76_09385 [Bacteroidales bacterium]|nr:hypothetical protein [Bacteroidales bacterium]